MYGLVGLSPKNIPSAIPVRAECPIASEKNAIFLLIIKVPKIPSIGPKKIEDIKALITKLYWKKDGKYEFTAKYDIYSLIAFNKYTWTSFMRKYLIRLHLICFHP